MRKLDFLIAGVQKGGTTALWHYLKQHPQVRFGPQKEMHFFDDESVNWSDPDYDVLHRHYADAPADCILGDATPIYSFWPPAIKRIHDYNSRIKLIVLLRDPISRAYSNWRMEAGRGNESLRFSEAIRVGRDRINTVMEGTKCHRYYSYLERGLFAQQLDRIYRHFSKEQVLLIKSQRLKMEQRIVLDEVTEFLGIENFADYPQDTTVFRTGIQTPEMTLEDLDYLKAYFRDDSQLLLSRYGISFDQDGNEPTGGPS